MKWILDNTGRFSQRPYFEKGELDRLCEKTITQFLAERCSTISFPIATDDLTVLLEQHASDLDLYADLSSEGLDVEGVTHFNQTGKPSVKISDTLHATNRENRLRTTLTHELGHVLFHKGLWSYKQFNLFADVLADDSHQCKRETILGAQHTDWMEWQAGYASGALLMPLSYLDKAVNNLFAQIDAPRPIAVASADGQRIIEATHEFFQVSKDAARVRLLQLEYLFEGPAIPNALSPQFLR